MVFHKVRSFIFNFFHFNKQERNGVFMLSILIVVLFAIRQLMPWIVGSRDPIQVIYLPTNNSTPLLESSDTVSISSKVPQVAVSAERFVFNPNTVTFDEAIKLGFSKKLSLTLDNFRKKGGKFFKAEDVKRLYGMSDQFYAQLEPYILIPRREYKADSLYPKPVYEKKIFAKETLELNSADSLSIVYLRGIGPAFTRRILKYRQMLGGFHSINQLREVYGMTDSLFITLTTQIKLDDNAITKIPINAIDFNSLRRHPYFNFQSAQAIVNYRFKHGRLDEQDIKQLGIFNEEKLKLILPYLRYE